jgi:hypothetical protein
MVRAHDMRTGGVVGQLELGHLPAPGEVAHRSPAAERPSGHHAAVPSGLPVPRRVAVVGAGMVGLS